MKLYVRIAVYNNTYIFFAVFLRGGFMLSRQNSFLGYLLIGVGAFFLLRQLKIPILTDFYSWPTLLIIIGLVLMIYSYRSKEYHHLFSGTFILGLGIHFHGLNHYAVYSLLIGIAFVVRALKIIKGMILGLFFILGSLIIIFSIQLPEWFDWVYQITNYLESYWPIVLIIIGIYLLMKKK